MRLRSYVSRLFAFSHLLLQDYTFYPVVEAHDLDQGAPGRATEALLRRVARIHDVLSWAHFELGNTTLALRHGTIALEVRTRQITDATSPLECWTLGFGLI